MSAENVLVVEGEDEVIISASEETPPADEPVSTDPEQPVATGEEEPAAPESDRVDEEPEPDSEMEKKIAKLIKQSDKQAKKIGYLTRKLSRKPKDPEPSDKEAPSADKFDTYEKYQDALVDYKVEKGINDYQKETAATYETDDLQEFIDDTLERGRENYSDFADVAEAKTVSITKPMLKIMRDSEFENPEGVAYYLGKNPKEAVGISRMSPVQATRALTRIEANVTASRKASPNPRKNKKVSDAPPPVKPTGSAALVEKDPEKMNQREYEEWRSKGGGV